MTLEYAPAQARAALGPGIGVTPWEAEVGAVRVRFGPGRLAEVGELALALGARRALVVTDLGVRMAGHVERAVASLAAVGLAVEVYDGSRENPTAAGIAAAAATVAPFRPDLLIGLGGGSALDTAKGVNFLLTNGGRMEDYRGFGKASRPLLPAIGVPTTAGTGSEAQSYAILVGEGGKKMACGDEKARFRTAVLDPRLTASVPFGVAARAGLDAIAHAVESFASRRANPVSRLLARAAWELLEGALADSLADPAAEEPRGRLLLGAHLAGAAIEQSMLGAAHACANPLSAHYDIPHGAAIALVLPPVVRFNGQVRPDLYAALAAACGLAAGGGEAVLVERVARRIEELRGAGGLPGRLAACGVAAGALPALAREASLQWTAGFNPRPVGETELLEIYRAAW